MAIIRIRDRNAAAGAPVHSASLGALVPDIDWVVSETTSSGTRGSGFPGAPEGTVSIVRTGTSRIFRADGSGQEYQIRSELSCTPPPGWIDYFRGEMTAASREAGIRIPNRQATTTGRHLLSWCSCDDVAITLSQLLKPAIAAAGRSYQQAARDGNTCVAKTEGDWRRDSQGRWI